MFAAENDTILNSYSIEYFSHVAFGKSHTEVVFLHLPLFLNVSHKHAVSFGKGEVSRTSPFFKINPLKNEKKMDTVIW